MLEDLKFALFNLYEDQESHHFIHRNSNIEFIYCGITLIGYKNEISVFYDPTMMGVFQKSRYLNKKNTFKTFNRVSAAINYMKYLAKAIKDMKYELYHYFLFKLREIQIEYNYISFSIVNDNTAVRCDFNDLNLKDKVLSYNFIFVSKMDGSCELRFYPKNPVWNEGKYCPEKDIDKIVDYIASLSFDNYNEIILKET